MGIKKSLSLQMIPWCFHVMAGSADDTGCEHPAAAKARPAAALCTRLIRADGRVEVYHRKVSAAELMKEHPMHLVCRSDAFTIGQRIPALADADQLLPGHAYFLLPLHLFQSVLSFVALVSSFARAASNGGSNGGSAPFLLQRLFEVHKAPAGKLQIRVRDDFIRRIQEAQEATAGDQLGSGGGGRVLCTTAALEKDYRQLVMGCRERQWKPKLETITEYSERKKRGKLSAVGGAAGALDGIRRRSKMKKLAQQAQLSLPEKLQQQLQKKLQKQKASDLHLAHSGRKNKAAGAKETRSLKREITSSKLD